MQDKKGHIYLEKNVFMCPGKPISCFNNLIINTITLKNWHSTLTAEENSDKNKQEKICQGDK